MWSFHDWFLSLGIFSGSFMLWHESVFHSFDVVDESICMNRPHFVFILLIGWTLDGFHFFAMMSIAAMNIHLQLLVWTLF